MKKDLCIVFPPWIKTASKALVLTLLIILCGIITASCTRDSNEVPDAIGDADVAQMEYLDRRIRELEKTLASIKSNSYISDAAYKLKIDELEKELERLKKETYAENTGTNSPETQGAPDTLESTAAGVGQKNTLKFSVEDGKAIITGYVGNGTTLVIPSSIDGYPVEKIADEAFARTALESVVVEEGVKYIGWFAFSENVALKSVTLPDSIVKAEYGVFNGCGNKLRVYCKKNSYIHKYASSYGVTVEER